MSNVNETAYPQLKEDYSPQELEQLFSPTAKELNFAEEVCRRASARATFVIYLKVVQRVGYSVVLETVPLSIVAYVSRKLRLPRPSREALVSYDASGEKGRHFKRIREVLRLKEVDETVRRWMQDRAEQAAATKHELADIINALLEELVDNRYLLPGFTILDRIAQQARESVNSAIYDRTAAELDTVCRARLDALLVVKGDKSDWDRVKKEPGRPTAREVAKFLQHIRWLRQIAVGLPTLGDVAATKRAHLTLEARALDASDMRSTAQNKRYTLAVLLIQSQIAKSTDDIAEIFLKTVRKLDSDANKRLQKYKLEQDKLVERLLVQFRGMLKGFIQKARALVRIAAMEDALLDPATDLIEDVDEYMAYAENNYFPFMLKPYRVKRSLLFECLDVMQPSTTYRDDDFARALVWMLAHRRSHKELLRVDEEGGWNLDRFPAKWRQLIVRTDENGEILLHRKFLELYLFNRLYEELQSGDLFLANSEQFGDYRAHFMEEGKFQQELAGYLRMLGFPGDAKGFTAQLRAELEATAEEVDKGFPANDGVALGPTGLVIRKVVSEAPPKELPALEELIDKEMGQVNVLEALIQTERWLGLHKLFKPLSGFESKLDNPIERVIGTLFCYGFNMGPTQTARSLKGFSRKQIAWLDLHHVTEERLDKAIVKTINAYERFKLPQCWGSGKSASADGTKWAMYERNLLSEYHIRYGGYGGIGYYHVSDKYIALFSHFIPCGVYEAIYILDGLLKNDSDIRPNTLHGDTQAQNTPVFALAHLLGIDLLPRIRNIKDLTFFKPTKDAKYENIQSLFRGDSIDWALIERHFEDMMRVAVSIKAGLMTPSTLLRRLGSKSRKNKLYFAFRELGRVVRTRFLLRYISDPKLRQTIHAATNKSEQFNDFAKWTFFGGNGVIAENIRHEQRKVVKYNHLVANMLIVYTVHRMTGSLNKLHDSGRFLITQNLARHLSPYRRFHYNRYGDYPMDLDAPVEVMNLKSKFF